LVGVSGQLQFDERTGDEISFAVPASLIRRVLSDIDGYEDPEPVEAGADPFKELSERYREVAAAVAPSLVRVEVVWVEDSLVSEDHSPGPFSGFIIDPDGLILTSLTPLQGHGDRIRGISVTLHDDSKYVAERLGNDYRRDLALLRVDRKDLPVPEFAPADSVRVGRPVLALGSAFGALGEANIYSGVVSGLRREQNSVQTDAYLYHGNRGGPLVDLDGRVIGPLVQLYEQAREKSGVAFAIPMEEVRGVLPDLTAGRDLHLPELGVLYAPPGIEEHGPLIIYVKSGSAAERAGIRPADVITRCNGERIRNAVQLVRVIQTFLPRDEVTLTVLRSGGEEVELEAVLGRR